MQTPFRFHCPRNIDLVMWRWSPETPARVVLTDDEGRLSGGTTH